MNSRVWKHNKNLKTRNSSFEGRDFVANLTSSQAEDELNRKFNKQDFESLEVIGQFNKGFIIARLKVGYSLNTILFPTKGSRE